MSVHKASRGSFKDWLLDSLSSAPLVSGIITVLILIIFGMVTVALLTTASPYNHSDFVKWLEQPVSQLRVWHLIVIIFLLGLVTK